MDGCDHPGAGLIHASWNIAAKKAGGDIRFPLEWSLVAACIAAGVLALG